MRDAPSFLPVHSHQYVRLELSNLENFARKMWFMEKFFLAITRKTMRRAQQNTALNLRKPPLTTF